MRKLLVVLLVAALMPTAAYANVIGSWAETPGATWDTFKLTATPNGGTTFIGFDIEVFDTAYVDNLNFDGPDPGWDQNGNAFSTGVNGDNNGLTHFMLRISHNPSVQDLVTAGVGVDGGSLGTHFDCRRRIVPERLVECVAPAPDRWRPQLVPDRRGPGGHGNEHRLDHSPVMDRPRHFAD